MSIFKIEIENCNNINRAEVILKKGSLNIKYGPNGLGKSTIARAIKSQVEKDGSLATLKPFKYRKFEKQGNPSVIGADDIKAVLVFDDIYVSQFVFQKEEVVKNSFDIFIKSEGFIEDANQIEDLLKGLKESFDNNEIIEATTKDLRELYEAFGNSTKNGLPKNSRMIRAFGSGNNIENIPDELIPYKDFIQSETPATWISWQIKGNEFSELSENCPYCSSNIAESGNKDISKVVEKTYNGKSVEHLGALQKVITSLGGYFESSCQKKLDEITRSKIELSEKEIDFLKDLRKDLETLISKLDGIRQMSFYALRDVEKIEDEVKGLKIDLNSLDKINSKDTQDVVNPINEKLENLLKKVGDLKAKINTHKKRIQVAIVGQEKSVNNFLKLAGYKYIVKIKAEAESYQMKLVHEDFDEHIEMASAHLSYGEKNAFAMVLFMHQALKEAPELVVLDDPVSSFDKTKKFAILNELFKGQNSLCNRTVLMLTHDVEPLIDIVKTLKGAFQQATPTAHFLSSVDGNISELEVYKDDIQSFAKICMENIENSDDCIIQCIYLRRFFEINNILGLEYNYLSSLLHCRPRPGFKEHGSLKDMDCGQAEKTAATIKEYIPDFSYDNIIAVISDKAVMLERFSAASANCDKIQLFRIFNEVHNPSGVNENVILRKFLNESFHIENEYIMQLNPRKFNIVPDYIIAECERIIGNC